MRPDCRICHAPFVNGKNYIKTRRKNDYCFKPRCRLYAQIKKEGKCWRFTGRHSPSGYGDFSIDGKSMTASAASFIIHGGVLTRKERYVLHNDDVCKFRDCVRPSHLRRGTQKQNIKDTMIKGTHISASPTFKGETHPRSKLSEKQVLRIQRLYKECPTVWGAKTKLMNSLAEHYQVHIQTIRAIVYKYNWKSLGKI